MGIRQSSQYVFEFEEEEEFFDEEEVASCRLSSGARRTPSLEVEVNSTPAGRSKRRRVRSDVSTGSDDAAGESDRPALNLEERTSSVDARNARARGSRAQRPVLIHEESRKSPADKRARGSPARKKVHCSDGADSQASPSSRRSPAAGRSPAPPRLSPSLDTSSNEKERAISFRTSTPSRYSVLAARGPLPTRVRLPSPRSIVFSRA